MVKLSKTDLWNPQNSDVFTGKPYWKLLFNLFVSLSAILLKTDFLKEFSLHDFCKIAFFKISLRFPSNKAADLKSFGCTFTENDVLVKNLKNYILARLITVGKVAKYGVFSGPYFPSFGQNTDQRKRRIWTLLSQCILCKKYIWILKFMSIPPSKFPKRAHRKFPTAIGRRCWISLFWEFEKATANCLKSTQNPWKTPVEEHLLLLYGYFQEFRSDFKYVLFCQDSSR